MSNHENAPTDSPTLASASVSPELQELIERARRLLSAAQPDDGHVKRVRYDHGGGRMFRAVPRGHGAPWHDDEDRTLMIDAYQEGDREFHFAAASLVRDLASSLTRLQQGIEQVRKEMLQDAENWKHYGYRDPETSDESAMDKADGATQVLKKYADLLLTLLQPNQEP
jgi:hypothetical protein